MQNFIPATTIQPYDATVRGVGRNFRNTTDPLASDWRPFFVRGCLAKLHVIDLLIVTAAKIADRIMAHGEHVS